MSLIPIALNIADFNSMLSVSIVFGVYFGLGLPITLGNYAASLEVGKRAKISGITYLIIALLTAVLSILVLNRCFHMHNSCCNSG